jgi:hypothetical protein
MRVKRKIAQAMAEDGEVDMVRLFPYQFTDFVQYLPVVQITDYGINAVGRNNQYSALAQFMDQLIDLSIIDVRRKYLNQLAHGIIEEPT